MGPNLDGVNGLSGRDAEALSAALGHIYDAALDAGLWPAAIKHSCDFLNCGGGAIGSFDILRMDSTVVTAWGFEEKYLGALSSVMKTNSLARSSMQIKVGEVGALVDGMSYEEFYRTEAYRVWARPQGIIDVMQATLDRTATSATVIGYSRFERHGRIDLVARQRLELLAPHLRRAVLIGKSFEQTRVEAAAFADTIDGLSAGVFLVDADCRLIHVNQSGSKILAKADILQLSNGVLFAGDIKANRSLRAAVREATRGDTAMNGTTIAMTTRSGQRYIANLLPLGSGRRRQAAVDFSSSAAIFVSSTKVNFPGPIQSMSAAFSLTGGETRILHCILEVQGVPATATLLGISQATVKTHLRNIFRKTNTHNQGDLTRLAAGHVSPLA